MTVNRKLLLNIWVPPLPYGPTHWFLLLLPTPSSRPSKICDTGPGPDQTLFCNADENMREEKKGSVTDPTGSRAAGESRISRRGEVRVKKKIWVQFEKSPTIRFYGGLILSKWIFFPSSFISDNGIMTQRAATTSVYLCVLKTSCICDGVTPISHNVSYHSNKICSVNDLIIKVPSSRINKSVLLCLLAFK